MMTPRELNDFCRALDLEWPATLAKLEESKRIQSQVWHPDRHQSNERLRLRGEEQLKRINVAYDRLREYLLAGKAPTCPACANPVVVQGTHCAGCQRKLELDNRERELRRRERSVAAREREAADLKRFVDIAGTWTNDMGIWVQFLGTGPDYQFVGGGILGQTESGTANVSGNTVVVRANNVFFGFFSCALTVDGSRLHGIVQTHAGSGAVEWFKA